MKKSLLLLFMACLYMSASFAQTATVTGKITDQNNQPLSAVTVKVKGAAAGTSTDADGRFTIVSPANGVLQFSSVGYEGKELNVEHRSTIEVIMSAAAGMLGDVVVVGYGTQKRRDVTGSIVTLQPGAYRAQPILDASAALQGRVAGVQVTNTSGAPGSEAKIHIRGPNSINASNSPLYVVDGIALSSIRLQDINVNDIQSIDVLKDASATAIYGSRGANGVVLITTKSGKAGAVKIDYNGFASTNRPMKLYDLRNGVQFATQANLLAGSQVFPDPSAFANSSTDWQKLVLHNGVTQSHQLAISGGTEKSRYYVSGYYADQSGLLVNTMEKKFAIRSSLESKINQKLSFSAGIFAERRHATNNSDIGSKGNPVTGALAWAPTERVYDSGHLYNRTAVSPIWANPYMVLKERNSHQWTTSALLNGKLTYLISPSLRLDILAGLNWQNLKTAYLNNEWISPGNPSSGQGQRDDYTFQNSNILTFHKLFNQVHDLTVVALEESSTSHQTSFNADGSGLSSTSNGYNNLGLNSSQSIRSGYSNWALLSFVARASYAYKGKYLVTATFRADGSSKFQTTSNKWGYFPSVGAGWRLSEEDFIRSLHVFSNLKLRGSIGVTGSQAIDPYSSLGLLTPVQYAFGTSVLSQGYMEGNPANPNLKWETTHQQDLGLDMGFMNNRINLTIDYYHKKTKDLLLNTPIPGYNGGGTYLQNIGVVSNRGVEFTVDVTPVQNKAFTWTSTFNASFSGNKVESLGKDSVLFRPDFVGQGFINTNIQVVKVGQPMGAFYLIPWQHIYTADDPALGYKAGDNRYQDVNGDGKIDFEDRIISGSALPKALLGWNNNFRYNNFELNVFFQASLGNKIFNATYAMIAAPNSDVYYPTLAESTDYWTSQHHQGKWANPGSTTGRNFAESTQYLQDGSYCRLKNISLSFDFPRKWMADREARITISAQNVMTFTKYKGYDPEASSTPANSDASAGIDFGAYPSPKTYSVALHIGL